ncbi:hypothetical protein CPB84DRAFT_1752672 [Gymnopilus junonius]|uniref:Uncharacterized protein n=1 Tax=Gymnopilus junonius TaxID=109634 RepID=A0A9P5NCE0_GYMJU|nr:hypothetical protein CPB84DRAFT_1752672 [Gymnopilus junonius]
MSSHIRGFLGHLGHRNQPHRQYPGQRLPGMLPKVNLRALPEMPDSRDAVPLPIERFSDWSPTVNNASLLGLASWSDLHVAGPSVPQMQKRVCADTQESTNEPSHGQKDTQRPNDDARTSQARRQHNAGTKKAGTARTTTHHRKRQRTTFEAPDNDDDVPDSTNDTVAGHADDEGNEHGMLHAASKPGIAKGSTRKGREIVEASKDDDGASGDDDGASGDNDGTSGDNDGASEDNEDNTTAPPPFTHHTSNSQQVDKASTRCQALSRPPTHLDNPHLDVRTQREHSAVGRNVDPTHLSGHTGSKKKVGWVEESESEELGGYGEEEGGRSEQSSSSVEVIAVQYSQPQAEAAGSQHKLQTKDKGKDKGKAKCLV